MYSYNSVSTNNYNNTLSFQALPKKYSVVDECLIRGSHPHVMDVFRLKKEGINQIYDFRENSYKGFKFAEKIACKLLGIKYIRIKYSFYTNYSLQQKIIQELQDRSKKMVIKAE